MTGCLLERIAQSIIRTSQKWRPSYITPRIVSRVYRNAARCGLETRNSENVVQEDLNCVLGLESWARDRQLLSMRSLVYRGDVVQNA